MNYSSCKTLLKSKKKLLEKYNTDTDEELLDKLQSDYVSKETIISLTSITSSWNSIDGYKFNLTRENKVSVYADGILTGNVKCTIHGNYIKIGNNKSYYAKDSIYLVAESKVHNEISLKVFLVEK